ncbi:hypothetical protein C4J90_4325 [Pseudomonas sp. R2-60-08W]|nr:hypothetical protein C4J91_4486 [Pseudomonas sp. R3-52-08]AZF28468.1 hypothetical protein C4J90_4325 [Pseudomonas sp. R2-60-08W]
MLDCRSELAREKRKGSAFVQTARVIVDDFSRASSLLQVKLPEG